jgi:hypothetical protein
MTSWACSWQSLTVRNEELVVFIAGCFSHSLCQARIGKVCSMANRSRRWRVTDFGGKVKSKSKMARSFFAKGHDGSQLHKQNPKIDYEMSLEARRVDGSDFFCGLTVPVRDSHISLIVGGWAAAWLVFPALMEDAAHNDTTKFVRFVTASGIASDYESLRQTFRPG